MRVLFAGHVSGLGGGAELSLLELVTALHRDRGVQVVATTPGEGPLEQVLRAEGIPVHCLPTPLWTPFGRNPFGSRLPCVGSIDAPDT